MWLATETASAVNAVDIVILIVLGLAFIYGILRGFVLQLAGIVFLIAGLMLAGRFAGSLGNRINGWFPGLGSPMDDIIAFVAILVGTVVAGHILALMFRGLLEKMKLLSYDRFLGGVLALAKFGIIAGMLLYGFVEFFDQAEDEGEPMALVTMIKDSQSWPVIVMGADLVKPLVPDEQKEDIEDLKDRIREKAVKDKVDPLKGTASGD